MGCKHVAHCIGYIGTGGRCIESETESNDKLLFILVLRETRYNIHKLFSITYVL